MAGFFTKESLLLRAGSILLAVLLWVFVVSNNQYSMVIEVPIEVRNLSERKVLREEVPELAKVRFEGSGRALFNARLFKNFYSDFKLVLDLERISEEYDFVLNSYFSEYPNKVVIPHNLDLELVEVVFPREVHISLDEYMEKKVPVLSGLVIDIAPGHVQVGEASFSPKLVNIAGPKETIEKVKSVQTVSDTLFDLESRERGSVKLKPSDRLIEYLPNAVEFELDVQPISQLIISEIPVIVDKVPNDLRVFVNPRTVSLTVEGGVDRISEINPQDIKVVIDFSKSWDPDKQFYEPEITLPENVLSWKDLSPRNVELVLTRVVN